MGILKNYQRRNDIAEDNSPLSAENKSPLNAESKKLQCNTKMPSMDIGE